MRIVHLMIWVFVMVMSWLGKAWGQSTNSHSPFERHAHSSLTTTDSLSQKNWVDAQYQKMTLEERIGQLFMILISSEGGETELKNSEHLIKDYHLGGVIFSKGTAIEQVRWTNHLQKIAKTPLLIAMDAEWGPAMRLDDVRPFPWNMALGAIQNDSLLRATGVAMSHELQRLGVHLNFGPVVDVNTNPLNPIIGNRSFGSDPKVVATKAKLILDGFKNTNILSTIKHFPGHGDTEVDSHKGLPLLPYSQQRLDSIELLPFKTLIQQGVGGVMVAHMEVPSLDSESNLPTSMSSKVISQWLKQKMNFRGLVVSDALNMKGATAQQLPGRPSLNAFRAGNDILIVPEDVKVAVQTLKDGLKAGAFTEKRLEASVKKILKAKYFAGLHKPQRISEYNLLDDLNTYEKEQLVEQLVEATLTTLKNTNKLLPIGALQPTKIAYVPFGNASGTSFLDRMRDYAPVDLVAGKNIAEYRKKLKGYSHIIIGLHKEDFNPYQSYKFSSNELFWLQEIANMPESKTILSVFTSPYALTSVVDFSNIDAITIGYQNNTVIQQKMAELLFGAIGSKGKLPVDVNNQFLAGAGVDLVPIQRLGFTYPERVGLDSEKLKEIDRIVQNGIDSMMFPGAQVLVARRGKVVYNKAFGSPTYESTEKITTDHIYDLASLTKILATLPLLMQKEERGEINLGNTLSDLLPELKDTKLADITLLKTLSHYGRLPAWISFYANTLDKNRKPDVRFYRSQPEKGYSIPVYKNLYLQDAYKDSIYHRIGRQDLKSNEYIYSDLGYFLFKKYLEESEQTTLDKLVKKQIFEPLGIQTLTYNPLRQFPLERIVPSEKDKYFRHGVIQGYVHDMGAAMQGGVGGHAGLFGNALGVAKVMQMYLQGGSYGGGQIISKRTVKKFNTCYFCNKNVRRGVGFDKPQKGKKGPTCGCVSMSSFGHSGFTGTYTWADPEQELVYVFLSNRTYPSMKNNLIVKTGLRTRVQKAIYDAIMNPVGEKPLDLSP